MKLAKTTAIAFALSAMLAGPVLAQGTSTGGQINGTAQGRNTMQNGAPGSADDELNAQTGTSVDRAGAGAKAGAKGTVGAGTGAGAHKGAGSDTAPGSKRY